MLGSFRRAIFFLFSLPVSRWGKEELLLGPQAGGCGPGLGAPVPCHLPDRCAIAVHNEADVPPYRRR